MPKALAESPTPEVDVSDALSLMARPGDGRIAGRKIALLVADGVVGESVMQLHAQLQALGAVPRLVAPRIGPVKTADGVAMDADASMENEPGFLFDALALPDGPAGVQKLAADGHTMEFIKDHYRHCKAILVMPASATLLEAAGVPTALTGGEPDPGIVAGAGETEFEAFIQSIAKHRHPERETDPPLV
jgi:catalase